MKTFYLATATIQHGEHQYLDAYPLPDHLGKPTYYQCVDAVFTCWFEDPDDPQPRIEALEEFHQETYAWLPCGERIVSNISYDLDHRRIVEHYFEQNTPGDLASRVTCFPQNEWGFLLGQLESLADDLDDVSAQHPGGLFCKEADLLADLMLVANTFIDYIESRDARKYVQGWIGFAQAKLELIKPSLH